MKKVVSLMLLLLAVVMAVFVAGCDMSKSTGSKTPKIIEELNLGGLLDGYTYKGDKPVEAIAFLRAVGAKSTEGASATIWVEELSLADGKKVIYIASPQRDEQFFIPQTENLERRLAEITLRLAQFRLAEAETQLLYRNENVEGSVKKYFNPPQGLTKLPSESWWDSQLIHGIPPDVFNGLSFDYQAPTVDDWRIDGHLQAHGAWKMQWFDRESDVKPDILVTWAGDKDDNRMVRIQYKGMTRDLVRMGQTADYEREIAYAFKDIAKVRQGKKVEPYARLMAGEIFVVDNRPPVGLLEAKK